MAKKHSIIKLITTTGIALLIANKYVDQKSKNKKKVYSTGSYFNYKYGDIYYNVYGTGAPIVLLHDLNSMSSGYEWEEIIDQFSKNHTVYVLDLLGCGQSDKPNITYTNYLFVEMLHDFLTKVVGEPSTIITSHNSGSIGIMTNHMYPDLVNNLILINPNDLDEISFTTTKGEKLLKKIIYLPLIGTAIYNSAYTEENIKKVLRETLFINSTFVEKYFDLYYQVAHYKESKSRYLYASIRCNYTNIDLKNGLKNKKNITLIHSKERFKSVRISEAYKTANNTIQAIEIENSKMLPQLEAPTQLSQIIDSILS